MFQLLQQGGVHQHQQLVQLHLHAWLPGHHPSLNAAGQALLQRQQGERDRQQETGIMQETGHCAVRGAQEVHPG